MKKGGKKTSLVHQARRQRDIAAMRLDGATVEEIVQRVGCSPKTVLRDLKKIGDVQITANIEEIKQRKQQAVAEIDALKKIVLNSRMSDSQKVRAFLACSVRMSKLLGLDAPQRSVRRSPTGPKVPAAL